MTSISIEALKRKNLGEILKKMYRCDCCDLEVKEIPKFKEGECSEEIQHYFREIEK